MGRSIHFFIILKKIIWICLNPMDRTISNANWKIIEFIEGQNPLQSNFSKNIPLTQLMYFFLAKRTSIIENSLIN